MKNLNISPKKRGKRGEGRTVIFKPLQLPEELIDDLKLYKTIYELEYATKKDEYGDPIPERIPFEQMLRHWMDNVKKFDPAVQKEFEATKKYRAEHQTNSYHVDPSEGKIWEMSHFFYRDGDELEAIPDEECLFYAILDGERKTMLELMNEEWVLMNEAAIEIDPYQARKVSQILLKHARGI